MKDSEKPKEFVIFKNINPPAKIIGLFYNTFFVFVLVAVLIFLGSSGSGIIGFISAGVVVLIMYIFLFFFQTKFGPKKVRLYLNYFMHPVNFLKVKKTFKNN